MMQDSRSKTSEGLASLLSTPSYATRAPRKRLHTSHAAGGLDVNSKASSEPVSVFVGLGVLFEDDGSDVMLLRPLRVTVQEQKLYVRISECLTFQGFRSQVLLENQFSVASRCELDFSVQLMCVLCVHV